MYAAQQLHVVALCSSHQFSTITVVLTAIKIYLLIISQEDGLVVMAKIRLRVTKQWKLLYRYEGTLDPQVSQTATKSVEKQVSEQSLTSHST